MASPPFRPPQHYALNVAPLNSIPYIDPITSHGDASSSQPQRDEEPVETAQPALMYFRSQPTKEEVGNVLSVTRGGVVLTGSAAVGAIGPVVGKMDLSENEDTYLFRVALPGVAREGFSCDVAPDGHILIKGVTLTGEKVVYKDSMKFVMQSQNLCPPGHFTISFQLPGPVESQDLVGRFGDGIFEGIVTKKKPSN